MSIPARNVPRDLTNVTPHVPREFTLPVPTLSAEIVDGVTTNTVKIRTARGALSKGRIPPAPMRPRKFGDTPKGPHRQRKLDGETVRQVCISLAPSQLAIIDRAARVAGMTRSMFLATVGVKQAAIVVGEPQPVIARSL